MTVESPESPFRMANELLKPPHAESAHKLVDPRKQRERKRTQQAEFVFRWCPIHNMSFKVKQISGESVLLIGRCPKCVKSGRVKRDSYPNDFLSVKERHRLE